MFTGLFAAIEADGVKLPHDESSCEVFIAGDEGQEEIIGILREKHPVIVVASPALLLELSRYDEKQTTNIEGISLVLSAGGRLTGQARRLITDYFKCAVRNSYIKRETGFIGIECRHACGFHIARDMQVEIRTEHGRLLKEERWGEVWARKTGAEKWLRTGDYARMTSSPCPCGQSESRLYDFVEAYNPVNYIHLGATYDYARLLQSLDLTPVDAYQLHMESDRCVFAFASDAEDDVVVHALNVCNTARIQNLEIFRDDTLRQPAMRPPLVFSLKEEEPIVSVARCESEAALGSSLQTVIERLQIWREAAKPEGRIHIVNTAKEEGAGKGITGALKTLLRKKCLQEAVGAENDCVIVVCDLDIRDGRYNAACETGVFGSAAAPVIFIADMRKTAGVILAANVAAGLDITALRLQNADTEISPALTERIKRGDPGTYFGSLCLAGFQPEITRRACPVTANNEDQDDSATIAHYADRCDACGTCESVCPRGCIRLEGKPVINPERCIQCFSCVEYCHNDAMSPYDNPDAAVAHEWAEAMGRLLHLWKCQPAPPPSYLQPVKHTGEIRGEYVLGLGILTRQEHAVALIRNGEIVGAVERERLTRVKHEGWHPEGRPLSCIGDDPMIPLEEAICMEAVDMLLKKEGIAIDDIAAIAVNGIPYRYRYAATRERTTRPLEILRVGRVYFVPHHLAHAASAYRVSGFDTAHIFTVDGRGDRETAAFFRAEKGDIEQIFEIHSGIESSIGGVYETMTMMLGFGAFGQGSTMALAAYGKPEVDFSEILHVNDRNTTSIREIMARCRFESETKKPEEEYTDYEKNLAASLQEALEHSVVRLIEDGMEGKPVTNICLAGGVALNCRMNFTIGKMLNPREIFVQPGANDAGTAIGAALEVSHRIWKKGPAAMTHTYFGPEYDNEDIVAALTKMGLRAERCDDIEGQCADLLAEGWIVCWFQGRMEFGPRALGNRSILADPRRSELHALLNRIKSRESWRPFGPSITRGRETEYLEPPIVSPFMLFAIPVIQARKRDIPVVVHADGTTRPQSVDERTNPKYHRLLEAFEKRTGLPLVVNTSFNAGEEPIVCTPEDALRSFARLGADYLAIGDYLVSRHEVREREWAREIIDEWETEERIPYLPEAKPRRLHLRLGTRCDCECLYCPIKDIEGLPERGTDDALNEMRKARGMGCTEIVFMRGEPLIRPDILHLVGGARAMGYVKIQLQTNARKLKSRAFLKKLILAGATEFEVLLSPSTDDTILHFTAGISNLIHEGMQPDVVLPVTRYNVNVLPVLLQILHEAGANRLQFSFPRPLLNKDYSWDTSHMERLATVAPHVRSAIAKAESFGMTVTTEMFPWCQVPPTDAMANLAEELSGHRVVDLHMTHPNLQRSRVTGLMIIEACDGCVYENECPRSWPAYFQIFGTDELQPVAG